MTSTTTSNNTNINSHYVKHFYKMPKSIIKYMDTLEVSYGFDQYSECVLYRTYSRRKDDGNNENWNDIVIRVIEGIMSIRKNHYINNHLEWDDTQWTPFVKEFTKYIYTMRMLPPGRGLWACGTKYMYERGAAALNNCGAATTTDLVLGAVWTMDMLMCGCGIGFDTLWDGKMKYPNKENTYVYVIPDSREGWVNSLGLLLLAYVRNTSWKLPAGIPKKEIYKKFPIFDYSLIRSKGQAIKGFGGTASGPLILKKLHIKVELFFDAYYKSKQNPENVNEHVCQMIKDAEERGCSFASYIIPFDTIYDNLFIKYCDNVNDLDDIIEHYLPLIMNDNLELGIANCKQYLSDNVNYAESIMEKLNGIHNLGMEDINNKDDYSLELMIFFQHLYNQNCLTGTNVYCANNLIEQIKEIKDKTYGKTRLIVDIFNSIGVCVVAGNVRRSAMLSLGEPGDEEFIKLKKYQYNPERGCIGWMSNNTVRLSKTEDFTDQIPLIAENIKNNGEPGIYNQLNIHRFGRVGRRVYPLDEWTREQEEDKATLLNPCLTRDTRILTDDGYVPIEQLIGKQFTAMIGSKKYLSTEKGFWHTGLKEVFKITTENGFYVKATDNHRFMKNGKWTEVKNLHINDKLIIYNGKSSSIESIESVGYEDVYDCCVLETHSFIANGFMSHNCSEIPLKPFELCNLSELFPTRCLDENGEFSLEDYLKACKYATFYSSTVSLLPTHWSMTNKVIAENRRIGVSMTGVADFYCKYNYTNLVNICHKGYRIIRKENKRLADEAGVKESIRVTTIKPSGTISSLVGVSPGVHFPTFQYAIRRIRIAKQMPIVKLLQDANVPYEDDVYSENTYVFEFPISYGNTITAEDVGLFEQATILAALQREWSDNMVSVTLYFNPETEADSIERVLALFIPLIKSASLLPHTNKGVYAQCPYEKIEEDEYMRRKASILPIDWSAFCGSDGERPNYCNNDTCEL